MPLSNRHIPAFHHIRSPFTRNPITIRNLVWMAGGESFITRCMVSAPVSVVSLRSCDALSQRYLVSKLLQVQPFVVTCDVLFPIV